MNKWLSKIVMFLSLGLMLYAGAAHAFDLPYHDYLNLLLLGNVTLVNEISDQLPKSWAAMTVDELKYRAMMTQLIDGSYAPSILNPGDATYITQWQPGDAERRARGSGHESFTPQQLNAARVTLVADQVFSHAIELDDLIPLQSQLSDPESALRAKMEAAVARKMDAYIFSLVSASTSAPDHLLGGVTDFNATALANVRRLASVAQWSPDERKILLLDPQYMNDLLAVTALTSADYAPDSAPAVLGRFNIKRHGFEIMENSSSDFLTLDTGATATQDVALAFCPSAIHFVMGKPQWYLVDNKPAEKFTFSLVLRVVGGAVRGHDHSSKVIVTRGTA